MPRKSGTPIKQAKNAIEACLGVLEEHDRFGLVTFSNGAEVFRDWSVVSTPPALRYRNPVLVP
jgi:hypothetical protein